MKTENNPHREILAKSYANYIEKNPNANLLEFEEFSNVDEANLIYDAMEEYASQFKTELSSKEALIGELKEVLELAKNEIEGWIEKEWASFGPTQIQHKIDINEVYQQILTALNKLK